MTRPITVDALRVSDFTAWQRLGERYNRFYEREFSQATYERTWARLVQGDGIHGFAARVDDQLLGITHYLFQSSIWTACTKPSRWIVFASVVGMNRVRATA